MIGVLSDLDFRKFMNIIAGEEFLVSQKSRLEQYNYPSLLYEVRHKKKSRLTLEFNSLTEHDLRNCFEHWQHPMQLCVNSEGNYFEDDCS